LRDIRGMIEEGYRRGYRRGVKLKYHLGGDFIKGNSILCKNEYSERVCLVIYEDDCLEESYDIIWEEGRGWTDIVSIG